MLASFVAWLDATAPVVLWTCVALLVVVDAAAVLTVATTKSRELVNKWTGPVLVVNALLLGTGTVVPLAMRVTSAAVVAVAPSLPDVSVAPATPVALESASAQIGP